MSDCTKCDPKYHCNSTNLIQPSGLCLEGYYCKFGSYTPNPSISSCDNFTESPFSCSAGLCPTGTFCRKGSESPEVDNLKSVFLTTSLNDQRQNFYKINKIFKTSNKYLFCSPALLVLITTLLHNLNVVTVSLGITVHQILHHI